MPQKRNEEISEELNKKHNLLTGFYHGKMADKKKS
jgi:hypothetical protein